MVPVHFSVPSRTERKAGERSRKHPVSYELAAARAGVVTRVPLGVRPIRVKRIVGSAGKADKLTADFLPLGPGPARAHFESMVRAITEGVELPPITVYLLGDRYFVIDGHTRVAAARHLGWEYIDADVTEALPRKEGEVNLTYYACRDFERQTGLDGIRLTAPWRYHLLLHHVEGYRLYLAQSLEHDVALPDAARIWYRAQYMPTITEIRRRQLRSTSGGRTAGDVYTDILRDWAQREGLAVSLREMLDQYDARSQQGEGMLTRARRVVSDVAEAALPPAVSSLTRPNPQKFADLDTQAELEALDNTT